MNQGDFFIGLQPSPTSNSEQRSYPAIDDQAVINEIARRVGVLEKGMRYAVQGDKVLSQIAICPEAILIQSDKIGILGEVTFADWHRDVSGSPTGSIDPSITQIRGGVIRTGQVVSKDGQSWLDLDAVGSTAFLKCRDTARINADGTFTFGNTSGKQLIWNGSDLTIGGNALVAGTAASTVVSTGNTALSTANTANSTANSALALANTANTRPVGDVTADILSQSNTPIVLTSGTAYIFKSKAGANGLFIGSGGLYGVSSTTGQTTFYIDGNSGAAWFGGSIETSNFVKANGSIDYSYTTSIGGVSNVSTRSAGFFQNVASSGGDARIGVIGTAANSGNSGGSGGTYSAGVAGFNSSANTASYGVYGTGGIGVYGAGQIGVRAETTTGGVALSVVGAMTITSSALVSNLNAQYVGGFPIANLRSLSNIIANTSDTVGGTAGVSFEFSTDGGTTYTPILLRRT